MSSSLPSGIALPERRSRWPCCHRRPCRLPSAVLVGFQIAGRAVLVAFRLAFRRPARASRVLAEPPRRLLALARISVARALPALPLASRASRSWAIVSCSLRSSRSKVPSDRRGVVDGGATLVGRLRRARHRAEPPPCRAGRPRGRGRRRTGAAGVRQRYPQPAPAGSDGAALPGVRACTQRPERPAPAPAPRDPRPAPAPSPPEELRLLRRAARRSSTPRARAMILPAVPACSRATVAVPFLSSPPARPRPMRLRHPCIEEAAQLIGHAVACRALHARDERQRHDRADDRGGASDVRADAARRFRLLQIPDGRFVSGFLLPPAEADAARGAGRRAARDAAAAVGLRRAAVEPDDITHARLGDLFADARAGSAASLSLRVWRRRARLEPGKHLVHEFVVAVHGDVAVAAASSSLTQSMNPSSAPAPSICGLARITTRFAFGDLRRHFARFLDARLHAAASERREQNDE